MVSLSCVSGSGVKTKWQYLRDTYRREILKINHPTGSASGGDSKWKFFTQMGFLHDTLTSRRLVGNVPRPDQSDADDHISGESFHQSMSDCDDDTSEQQSGEQQSDDQQSDDQQTDKQQSGNSHSSSMTRGVSLVPKKIFKSPKKRPRQKKDALHDLVQLEKVKVAHLQELQNKKTVIEEDEDYHFLMSLLPHLRTIPQHNKLHTRIRLQQVLLECARTPALIHHHTPLTSQTDFSTWSNSPSPSSQQNWNTHGFPTAEVSTVPVTEQVELNPDKAVLSDFLRFKP